VERRNDAWRAVRVEQRVSVDPWMLARSRLTPVLCRLPVRGPARLIEGRYRAKPPHGEVVATDVFGDRIHADLSSWIEWNVWAKGYYELETLRLVGNLTSSGRVVVDVGANVGLMTIRAARRGARVVAIEADPRLAARLKANVELNRLSSVRIVEAAATSAPGVVTLHLPAPGAHNHGQASLLHHGYLQGSVEVPGVPIDDLDLADVGLIKIDVEGAEGEVVRGAWRTIERWRPHIVFEMTPDMAGSDYRFVDELVGMGYRLQSIRADRHPVTGRVRGPLLVPLDPTISDAKNVLATPG